MWWGWGWGGRRKKTTKKMQRIEHEEALMEEVVEEMEKKPHLVNLPSFGAAPGDRLFSSVVDPEADEDDDDDFEFAIAAAGPDPSPAITADELFSDGRILPSYPLFNLDLLLPPAADPSPAEAAARSGSISSSSSSEAEDRGFCPWAPRSAPQSPERRAKKSASTGSSSSSPSSARRWRIRDLVVGRSSSDGKDKFFFLSSPPNPTPTTSPNPNPNPNPNPKKKGTKVVKEMDMVTAHKLFYAKGGGGGGGGDRGRRSFLPYRQELFGFFATRTHHPS